MYYKIYKTRKHISEGNNNEIDTVGTHLVARTRLYAAPCCPAGPPAAFGTAELKTRSRHVESYGPYTGSEVLFAAVCGQTEAPPTAGWARWLDFGLQRRCDRSPLRSLPTGIHCGRTFGQLLCTGPGPEGLDTF